MRSRLPKLLAVLLACLSCSQDAAAHPRGPNAAYVVTVEDESGRELPTFHHGNQTFVLGNYGNRYNIRVQNRTPRRIEAVVTVDGRDVISGRIGDYVRERGYLVDPYDDVVIEGFRQSARDVAAFRFTSPGGSYSSQMGTPENVGVIGVAVFPERVYEVAARPAPKRIAPPRVPRPQPYRDDGRRDRSQDLRGKTELRTEGGGMGTSGPSSDAVAEAPAASRSSASSPRGGYGYEYEAPATTTDNLGTEYGESVSSEVEERPFQRAHGSRPAALLALRYDNREGLIARGIALEPPYRPAPPPCGPAAFPGNRFAPPPCR